MLLVTGATGKVGRHVVRGLVGQGVPLRALSRRPDRARLPAGVEVAAGSPEDTASVAAALADVDRAFVVLVGDVEAQARGFAAAARSATGLRHVVLLSSSAACHPVPHRIRDEHIAAEGIIRAAVPSTAVLRPGPFHSNSLWWAGQIKETGRARCLVGDNPGAPVDPADVAAVGVAALSPEHGGRVHELTGPEVLTSGKQVAMLGGLLGRPLDFEVATEEEAVATFTAITGDRPTAEGNVRALHSPEVPWNRVLPTVAEVLGRPARPYLSWATEHIGAFR
ncbi:SDR family oxidoreductase [Streptomyces sp. ST2-7A]|uniref:SDR family oxidoreductase n=1 Tax=Streptomyces sp. ST2-7A TaxID=2907214 RepID=UPI001F1BF621|nr:NAD(P)H-binding protein [Streptomyces sp. ST2-7A]MCE7081124.1 NAD(P)H-binding protein [Streptomyces sp. ST2-7A]